MQCRMSEAVLTMSTRGVRAVATVTGVEDRQAITLKDCYELKGAEPESTHQSKSDFSAVKSSTAEGLGAKLEKEGHPQTWQVTSLKSGTRRCNAVKNCLMRHA